jgi:ligand-binding sensor domain-containing protein/serine phosphatase RsbU (regulator of sigma subunit)
MNPNATLKPMNKSKSVAFVFPPPSGTFSRVFCFLIFIFLSTALFSQEFFFEFYSEKEGLANPKVYSIVQDDNHLVWIGTAAGLSTFDGKTIINLSVEHGLASGGVKTIFKDSRGYLWFGHLDGGISRFDGKKFESRTDNLIVKNDITSFCEDKTGHLWITTTGSGAVQIFNPEAPLNDIKYEKYSGDRLSSIIFSSICLHDGTVCFITDVGMRYFDRNHNRFELYTLKGMSSYFQITCMFEDKDYNLWFGTYHGGVYKYLYKEKQIKTYDIRDGLASNWITSIIQGKNGIIWVGHYETGGITKIINNKLFAFNKDNGLSNSFINAISEDTEQNLLIGTRDRGFAIFKGEIFTKYINDDRIFPSTEIWKIIDDGQGKIWFGTNNGLVIYDPNASSKYDIKPGELGRPTQTRQLVLDRKKDIWIGTATNEIYLYNARNKQIESAPFYLDLNRYFLTSMAVDRSNNLWIGTSGYLYQYNIDSPEIKKSLSQTDGLPKSPNISAIYVDKENYKYIGVVNEGITVFKDSLTLKTSKHYPLLGNTTPNCMIKDDNGNLWIGTNNMGLLCFKEGKILKRYTTKDGLLSDIINMVYYNDGFIYAGSNAGLNMINLASGTVSVYTQRNGFGMGMKNNATYIDKTGQIWFGTADGAVRYNSFLDRIGEKYTSGINIKSNVSSKKKYSNPEPHIKITRCIINNQDTILLKPNEHFGYLSNTFTIQYISICLTNADEIEYKYILEGANNTWQTTHDTYATYNKLPPGEYTFKVIAKNYAGKWNTKPVEYTFYINPPFYKTWWFITAISLVGLILLLVYIKIREKTLIREKRVLEEKVKQRTAEIVKINQELALKNKDITDSIQYASRIQNALLPPALPFENTFVLFKPKDIVSGDFFWFMEHDNIEWFAAVDCTGHGVPGAFMSIIGHNSLNKILEEYNITKPSAILNDLNKDIADALHQYHQDNQIHDGMDIALACYNRETKLLEYSGAFNPLWLIRNNELIETRANRYAIGLAPGIEKDFTNFEVQIQPGDTIYLFSDGYADQFGGPDNKKMKIGNFKEVILKIQHLNMEEQKQSLDNFFEEWKLDYPQVDDVLVIGRRFVY